MDTDELHDIARLLHELAGRLEALAAAEPAAAPNEADEPAEAVEIAEAVEAVEAVATAGTAISFALNDRYRFMRELFGGSAEVMGKTLGEIAGLQSAGEVESYLIEHGYDTDSETVKDFMRATTRRFDSHPPLLG